jgi:hypothetical protein
MEHYSSLIVCLRCHKQGHSAKACALKPTAEAAHTAALLPCGHPGDLQLPVHRPETVLCHLWKINSNKKQTNFKAILNKKLKGQF